MVRVTIASPFYIRKKVLERKRNRSGRLGVFHTDMLILL